jgi:hypothetical protein
MRAAKYSISVSLPSFSLIISVIAARTERISLCRAEFDRQYLWTLLNVALVQSLQLDAHERKVSLESASEMTDLLSLSAMLLANLVSALESSSGSAWVVRELFSFNFRIETCN